MQYKNMQRLPAPVRRLVTNTKVRFILVGIANTAIDFILFNILATGFHADLIVANIISTTLAMAFSYTMNKQAVFKNGTPHSTKQVVLFLAVTLTGIWVVQTLIMVNVFHFLEGEFATVNHPWLVWFLQNVAKAVGVAAGAAWNYFGYSRIVFSDKPKKKR